MWYAPRTFIRFSLAKHSEKEGIGEGHYSSDTYHRNPPPTPKNMWTRVVISSRHISLRVFATLATPATLNFMKHDSEENLTKISFVYLIAY